jgi:hypothetical protein
MRPKEQSKVSRECAEGGALDPTPNFLKASCAGGSVETDAGALLGGGEECTRGKDACCNVSDVADAAEDIGEDQRWEVLPPSRNIRCFSFVK